MSIFIRLLTVCVCRYYGGWLAPNIFYLGHSGVVRVGGLRIAGLSGIYNSHHFDLGRFRLLVFEAFEVCQKRFDFLVASYKQG